VPTGSEIAYLDASALVKLAVAEDETGALRTALGGLPRRVSSKVSVVEVMRAVRRRDPSAEPLARRVLEHVSLLAIGDRVLVSAATLVPPDVRALDAIHLASALRLREGLTAFVSYDARQLRAAEALGLPVVSPR
jgi:predicted nucleic acid-binding protein